MSQLIPFTKMHGAGNDFIMVAERDLAGRTLDTARIAALCDRRMGIGADGLIVIKAGGQGDSAFRMTYFNADGGEAEMCGNGARCSVSFAHELKLVKETCRFDSTAGPLEGTWHGPGDIEVTLTPWRDLALDIALEATPWPAHHFCNTGVPHLVIPVENVEAVPVAEWGSRLRNHPRFSPGGANVNWVARKDGAGPFRIRTFERGVEAETLACGTGASAAAVVLCQLGLAESPVTMRTRGGDLLTVSVGLEEKSLRLRGPAVTSFHGEVSIDE